MLVVLRSIFSQPSAPGWRAIDHELATAPLTPVLFTQASPKMSEVKIQVQASPVQQPAPEPHSHPRFRASAFVSPSPCLSPTSSLFSDSLGCNMRVGDLVASRYTAHVNIQHTYYDHTRDKEKATWRLHAGMQQADGDRTAAAYSSVEE